MESVDPMAVHPLPDELAAYVADGDVSLSGMDRYSSQIREGKLEEPLLLQDLGDDGLWLNASTHGLGGGNSLALLLALRQAGVKAHPAFVYKEKLAKTDESAAWGAGWKMEAERREKLRSDLRKKASALVLAISEVSEEELFSLTLEGARYGGGVPMETIGQVVREAVAFNLDHANVFDLDMVEKIDLLVDGEYESDDELQEAVSLAFASFASRASRYATAGGNHAWALGLVAAMKWHGTPGGYWDCTFGSGSCPDCMSLHGRYMTASEFESAYHQTQCDGGCNCGFIPEEEGKPLDPEDLLGPVPED
jgi:hypothetical protein